MKTNLTPEVHVEIIERVKRGSPAPAASEASGRSWQTVKSWLARGRAAARDENGEPLEGADKPFARFADDFDQARATAVVTRVERVDKAGEKGDLKADLWWLEKRAHAFRPRAPKRTEGDTLPALPPGHEGTRTILVYPVPMPIGADPRMYALPQGHALETVEVRDTEGEEVESDD